MSFLRKPTPESDTTSGAVAPDKELKASLPGVYEFLTALQYPDGSTRVPSSVTVFTDEGAWKACLNDRDTDQVLFVTARTLWGCLEELEAQLTGESPAWRKSRSREGTLKGGKRKA